MTRTIPYSGKFSNGANFRIIRKRAVCTKIKPFYSQRMWVWLELRNRINVNTVVRTRVLAACDFKNLNFEILF